MSCDCTNCNCKKSDPTFEELIHLVAEWYDSLEKIRDPLFVYKTPLMKPNYRKFFKAETELFELVKRQKEVYEKEKALENGK